VEFVIQVSESKGGKKFASEVSGPNGAYVQGRPRPTSTRDFGGREGGAGQQQQGGRRSNNRENRRDDYEF
jgi:hypothetical protein